MKRTLFLMLFVVTSLVAAAQFKVYSSGNANLKCDTEFSMNKLSVGKTFEPYVLYGYQNGTFSQVTLASSKNNIALYGDARYSSNLGSGRAMGVLGVAGRSTDGYNYGVFGKICGTQNGAGIFGSIYDDTGSYVNGRYAGYFDGAAYVKGDLTVYGVLTPSDIRLKENISPISNTDGMILDKVLGMNVIEYNYKQTSIPEAERDSVNDNSDRKQLTKDKHFGLSAQELQTVYPNLVKKSQDGYLGVNYIELVPVLIRAIQELKAELDHVWDCSNSNAAMSRSISTVISTASATGNVLYQNTPNPFQEQTTIRFSLADDARDAAICIFDMTGKMLQKLPVSSGETSVSINGWELGEGMFLYTLLVNGKEIDTKRMIQSK